MEILKYSECLKTVLRCSNWGLSFSMTMTQMLHCLHHTVFARFLLFNLCIKQHPLSLQHFVRRSSMRSFTFLAASNALPGAPHVHLQIHKKNIVLDCICAHTIVDHNQGSWQIIIQNLRYKICSRFSRVDYTPESCEIRNHQHSFHLLCIAVFSLFPLLTLIMSYIIHEFLITVILKF